MAKNKIQPKETEIIVVPQRTRRLPTLSPKLMGALADELAKTLIRRLPDMVHRHSARRSKPEQKKLENSFFLDTSAIIDGRIFDVINLGLVNGPLVILESILLELKHIADSQNIVKKERGRNGLKLLEKVKKNKQIKLMHFSTKDEQKSANDEIREVDERLILIAKAYKGKIITCDYNLEKKATIQGVQAINVHALAQCLKVSAVPGEALNMQVLHKGKDPTQGVGYLDDGTMIVIEQGSIDVGKTVDVIVSRVIQTAAGRIFFAKKI